MRKALEVAYGILVDIFPRRFRSAYGPAMKLVFRDLVEDPQMSTADLMRRTLADCRYAAGGILLGACAGSLVVLIWYVVRSDVVPFDPSSGYSLIFLLFVAAGFAGKVRSGTLIGGLFSGLVAGAVSAVVLPGEYWLFYLSDRDPVSFLLSWGFAPILVIALAVIGIGATSLPSLRPRLGRGIRAFLTAWRSSN